MDITYKNRYGYTKQPTTESIDLYVEGVLTRTGERGIAEGADDKADRIAAALGRLCDILAARGVLTLTNVIIITNSVDEPVQPPTT